MILLIDNYDSFTFNLYQYLCQLGEKVTVARNDALTIDGIRKKKPTHLVISPGPGRPEDAGISLAAIRELAGELPIFGVCLGHQAIAHAFGAKVVRHKKIMHGKTSAIHHDGHGIFRDLPNPFTATRYHSLTVEPASVPDCIEVSARTDDGTIMALRHREFPIEGVQFHPESILTDHGHAMLKNFLTATKAARKAAPKAKR